MEKYLGFPVSQSPNSKNFSTGRKDSARKTLPAQVLEDDEKGHLTLTYLIQNNILKEYESWIHVLLNIVGDKTTKEDTHYDLGTPIQKGLEKIEDYSKENFKIKKNIISQINKNAALKNKLEQLKNQRDMIESEYKESTINSINEEKKQLEKNIQMLANELDEQSEKNRNLTNYVVDLKGEEYNYYNNSFKELKDLKEENLLLKKIMEMQTQKKFAKILKSRNIPHKYFLSSKLGNYSIEQEEHFKDDDFMFFSCS